MARYAILIMLLAGYFGVCAAGQPDTAAAPDIPKEETDTVAAPEFPIEELRQSAEEGDREAMNLLGYLLLSGEEGVEQNRSEGLIWLIRAASMGDVKAASNLGWLLVDGSLVEQDLEAGAAWLAKAADAGLPVAMSQLGDLYRHGLGVEQDVAKAEELYRNAFERGLGDAGYKLYDLKKDTYPSMTPEDQVKAGKYYYLRGAPSEGVKLFYMAADCGDPEALALLGDAYSRAIGVPYDHDLSIKYFVKAALGGNPSAQFVVGELLDIFPDALLRLSPEDFPDRPSDDPQYWYGKAAEAGVTDAALASERLLKE